MKKEDRDVGTGEAQVSDRRAGPSHILSLLDGGVLRTASFPCLTPKSGSGLVGPFRTARLFLNSGASPASAPRTAPPPSFLGLTEDRSLSGPEGELPAGGNPDGRIGRGLGVGCDPHKGLAV